MATRSMGQAQSVEKMTQKLQMENNGSGYVGSEITGTPVSLQVKHAFRLKNVYASQHSSAYPWITGNEVVIVPRNSGALVPDH